MKIMDFLSEQAVACRLTAKDKPGVIAELVQLLGRSGEAKEKDLPKMHEVLLNREALGSTGIGQGVAIPHGKTSCVTRLVAAFGVSQEGVEFGSLDGEPAYLFFLLVAPEDSAGPHLKALARISRLLKDKYFRDLLRQAKDEKTLLKIIRDEDQRRH